MTVPMPDFDVVVVGKGLFGTAAARHIALSGRKVLLLGPGEPAQPIGHLGVFSSHYDDRRIVRTTARDLTWAKLTQRSIAAYESLQEHTNIRFYHRHPGAHLVQQGQASVFLTALRDLLPRLNTQITPLPNTHAIQTIIPSLTGAVEAAGFIEHGRAGYLEPRRLIQAQAKAFLAAGGSLMDDIVDSLAWASGTWSVHTRKLGSIRASQVLVATGAYANSPGLLPRPLDLRVKSEHVLMVEVQGLSQTAALDFPSLVFERVDGPLSDFYLTPPQATIEGSYRIKMGCNTSYDTFLPDIDAINQWMRTPMIETVHQTLLGGFRRLFPGLQIQRSEGKKCIVTYTPKTLPMIGEVADSLFVVTGGNGMGAKASDAIGELAAQAVCGDLATHELYVPGMQPAFMPEHADDRKFSMRGMSRNVDAGIQANPSIAGKG